MSCSHCQHPLDWHGDRAVGGCDAGLTVSQVTTSFKPLTMLLKDVKGRALCSCPGYLVDASV